MISIENFTLGIAVMLMTGLLFGKLSKKLRIPNVTGYLLGGLLIGPGLIFFLFKLEDSGVLAIDFLEALKIAADIELGFIAFTVGSEFKLSYFKEVGMMPVIIAFAESLAAVIFITGGMLLFGVPLYFALAMGAVGGATAPAATIMVIRQYKAKGPLAQTTLSVVAIDDASALIFFGIAMAIVKSIINPGQTNIAITLLMPFIEIIGSLILGVISGFLFTVIIRFFKSRGNRLVLTIAFILLNIGICVLLRGINFGTEASPVHVQLSSLLACMGLGAIFCNTSQLVDDVMPLIDSFTPPIIIIFFVMSGANLEVSALSPLAFMLVAIYLAFRVMGKVFGTMISAKATKAPPVIQKWLGFGLLPQGGIAIGLSVIIVNEFNNGTLPNAAYNGALFGVIVICAVFVSEIFGPLLLKYALMKSGEGSEPPRKLGRRQLMKMAALESAGAGAASNESAGAAVQSDNSNSSDSQE